MRLPALSHLMVLLLAGCDAESADLENGKRIAEQWCVSCHAPGTVGGAGTAPPFVAVIRTHTLEQISAFWQRPHGAMPPVELKARQHKDLLAYIASLKRSEEADPQR